MEELAAKLDIPAQDIVFALDAIQSPVSLYEPVYAESGDNLYIMDQISDKKNKEDKWVEQISLKAAEVAQEIQISQAQVSRLEKRALKSMKNYLT